MPLTKDQIIAEAMALPETEREQVADTLWRSVSHPDREVEEAWIEEAERRLDEIQRGETTAVPGAQATQALLDKYSK